MIFDETACYICAKCTSGCPTAVYDPSFKPHVIVARSKVDRDELLNDENMWYCVLCKRCERRCPQNVSPLLIVTELKNESYKCAKAHVPKGFEVLSRLLRETGLSSKEEIIITEDFDEYNREEIGLPPLPKVNTKAITEALTELGFFDTRCEDEKAEAGTAEE
ncbi:MAG: 4Fe-4S dicluster domain-containing protein [Candidatus Heimdallarchaeota archaeon]|nr:4Fe-4S dicluster domain-containing protein [Candidatus Heimdallarchaeota archaeon]